MVISINPEARVPYVCLEDRAVDKEGRPLVPVAERTTFFLRDITYREDEAFEEMQVARSEVLADDGTRLQTITPSAARARRMLLQAGLVGWENLRDEAGNPVPFKTSKEETVLGRLCKPPTDETLQRLSGSLRDELASVIQMRARIGAEGRKKLLSLPPSPSTPTETSATAAPVES